MVYRSVQLVLPLVQAMHDFVVGDPPHTTSLPPDRRERLWRSLGPGKSGTEHASEEGRGNISTEERCLLIQPPTINQKITKRIKTSITSKDKESIYSLLKPPTYKCHDTKLIKDQASKDGESICSLVSWLLLWHRLEPKKTRARARMIVKLNWWLCVDINSSGQPIYLIGRQVDQS